MSVQVLAIGISIADADQTILDVDDVFQNMVGRTRKELLGRKALSFTFQADLKVNRPALNELAVGGPAFRITKRYVQADGDIIWVENHVSKIQGPRGQALISASTRTIDRPTGADALSFNYEWVRRACAFLVGGRRRLGGDVVFAPATEALLRLYRAELEGRSLNVDQLASESACSPSVMQRWVKLLLERDLIELEEPGSPLGGNFVRLSVTTERTLDGLLSGR